ncbi:MAG: MBL fold metallo-hydrolase [Acidobacteriota bacterium]|nr:MBL fold metallo-hydrolase [Acidobacteriota bacterium]
MRFWGVRGSLPVCGPDHVLVGGNTSCVEIRAGDEHIILDAGTGMFGLGASLPRPLRATVLLSHYHWDHIQGFSFFRPAFEAGNFMLVCGPDDGGGVEEALRRQMQPPHFPVSLDALSADLRFRTLRPGNDLDVGPARVLVAALRHPQHCLGYRIELGGASVVYATDNESIDGDPLDRELESFAHDADLLILDAQYTEEEYEGRRGPCRRGWGHTTVRRAGSLAMRAGARRLALFHHDPTHTDEQLFRLVRDARTVFPNTVVACEGETIEIAAAVESGREDWYESAGAAPVFR